MGINQQIKKLPLAQEQLFWYLLDLHAPTLHQKGSVFGYWSGMDDTIHSQSGHMIRNKALLHTFVH